MEQDMLIDKGVVLAKSQFFEGVAKSTKTYVVALLPI